MKALCSLLAVVLLAGCATAHKMPTKSGLPEIESSADLAKLMGATRKMMFDVGAELSQESAHLLIYDVRATGAANFWFQNTVTGFKPVYRLRFNFNDTGIYRRVTMTQWLVRQPGLGGLSEAELDSKRQREDCQRILEKIKTDAEH